MEHRFFIANKALIFCGNKFLIVKRSMKARAEHAFWEFPGGRMEFGEQPEEALNREIMEETGLIVKILCPFSVWSFSRDGVNQLVGINYICTSASDNITLSDEHTDYAWITKDEISNYNMHTVVKHDMDKWNWDEIYKKLGR